jgi:hypothetical protein
MTLYRNSLLDRSQPGAANLLANESLGGLAIDMLQPTPAARMRVIDLVTNANNYLGDVDGKLTYTSPSTKYVRGTDGVYVGATTLRLDYLNSNTPLGLYIEDARTNALLRSQEFDNASWTKTSVTVTADNGAGFLGTTTADKLAATGANGNVSQGVVVGSNFPGTFSVFLRRVTGTGTVTIELGRSTTTCTLTSVLQRFEVRDTALAGTYAVVSNVNTITITGHNMVAGDLLRFDSTSGTAADANLTVATVVDANNITCSQVTADTSGNCNVYARTSRVKIATNGDAVDADQAQYEANIINATLNVATSPIITAGATATRAVDAITLATSAVPFNALEGTIIASLYDGGGSTAWCTFDDTTSNERMVIDTNTRGSKLRLFVVDGGATQVNSTVGGSGTEGTVQNASLAYKLNDFAGSYNGTNLVVDTAATIPTPTQIEFGRVNTASSQMGGWLRRLVYVPRRMDNGELMAKTRDLDIQ